MRATRLSVANYNTTLSSDSLESGTGSSNSLRSASQSLALDLVTDAQRYTIGVSRLVTPGLCGSCFPILNARDGNAGR
jgi:hypothetical protein